MNTSAFFWIKNLSRALIAGLGLVLASSAMAGAVSNAKITKVLGSGGAGNGFFVYVDTAATTAAAACATQTTPAGGNRWVLDPSTAAGKAGIAAILLAQATGKTIHISGAGTCAVWGDTETVAWVTVVS